MRKVSSFAITEAKENGMNKNEMAKLQNYLRMKFNTDRLTVQPGTGKDAPAEVVIGGEFIGVVYRNEDEGEVSYDFNMAVLDVDLD